MNFLLLYWILYSLGRLFFLSEGAMLRTWRYRFMVLLHVVLSVWLFDLSELHILLIACVLILDTGIYVVEQRLGRSSPMARSITLFCGMALGVFFMNLGPGYITLRETSFGNIRPDVYCFVLSMILCLKESNFLIRWFFQHYQLIEKVKAEKDAPETANGRIIGNLERLLLMCFLWEGAVVAATFIVAVKGLARFKKMEEHQAFAEYVIIGTFLSVLVTLMIFRFCQLFVS